MLCVYCTRVSCSSIIVKTCRGISQFLYLCSKLFIILSWITFTYFNCFIWKRIQPVVLTYIVEINDTQCKILNNIDLFPVSETKKIKVILIYLHQAFFFHSFIFCIQNHMQNLSPFIWSYEIIILFPNLQIFHWIICFGT